MNLALLGIIVALGWVALGGILWYQNQRLTALMRAAEELEKRLP